MCLYWNSYPGLLRVIGCYEFVWNVKISGIDIFFNAVFLFEVFKKYWSSLLQQQCVLSLLEILWSQFSFQKIQVFSKDASWLPAVAMFATLFHSPSPPFLQKSSAAATHWVASCPVFKSERFLGNIPALYDFVSVGILIWSSALDSGFFLVLANLKFFKLIAFTLKKILICSLFLFRSLI